MTFVFKALGGSIRTAGDIKNLTFRNRNMLRITHLFYVHFMIMLRTL